MGANTSTLATAPAANQTFHTQYAGEVAVVVTVAPDRGPAGTRVHVTGSGFTGDAATFTREHAYFFVLKMQQADGCELLGFGLAPALSVDDAGRLDGSFTVPDQGSCFQDYPSPVGRALRPGTYTIILGPHPADLAPFDLAPS